MLSDGVRVLHDRLPGAARSPTMLPTYRRHTVRVAPPFNRKEAHMGLYEVLLLASVILDAISVVFEIVWKVAGPDRAREAPEGAHFAPRNS